MQRIRPRYGGWGDLDFMNLKRFSICFVLALVLTSCNDTLTRDKAREIIVKAGSPIAIPPEESASSVASLVLVKSEQKYQYDNLQENLAQIYKKAGFMEEYNYLSRPYVRLTEKGKKAIFEIPNAQKTMEYFGFSNREIIEWKSPYARPEMGEITGISPDSDTTTTIQVKFIWERNDLGKLIQNTEKQKTVVGVPYLPAEGFANGKMRRYDDGWRLESLNSVRQSPSALAQ